MSFLEYSQKSSPSGLSKVFHLNWALILLIIAVSGVGLMMLYSVAGGSMRPWAMPQLQRFVVGFAAMLFVAFTPIWFWRNIAGVAYGVSILLLLLVEIMGSVGMGAQRWIDLGFIRLQPSEMAKITVVMLLRRIMTGSIRAAPRGRFLC